MKFDLSWWTCGTCHYFEATSNQREGLCRCEPSKTPRTRVQASERGCGAHEQLVECSRCGVPMLLAADVFKRDAPVCDDCATPELELIAGIPGEVTPPLPDEKPTTRRPGRPKKG